MNKIAENNVKEMLSAYVAHIRSLYLIHQNHHWQCSGPNFYSNHLLFERLYTEAAEQADMLAEKVIGLFGVSLLELGKQANLISALTSVYAGANPDNFIADSLAAEKDFIKFCGTVKDYLTKIGNLSLGLDDLIMELASKSEGRVYLLQQTSSIKLS